LLGFLIASAVVLIVSFVTTILMSWAGAAAEPQDLVLRVLEPRAPHEPWLIAGFGVLIAPVTEEYVFRGLLYPAIRDRSSRFVGALVSSVMFGVVHMSWTAGPALFALAMLLCYLYERTGSVWPGILVHVLNNATSLLPLFLLA
jgi:membrane protease YdiL (CAAX protease family)